MVTAAADKPLAPCGRKVGGIAISRKPVDPNCIIVEQLLLVRLSRAASERQKNVQCLHCSGLLKIGFPYTTAPMQGVEGLDEIASFWVKSITSLRCSSSAFPNRRGSLFRKGSHFTSQGAEAEIVPLPKALKI